MATNKASQVITGVARQTLCAVIPAKAGIFLALGTLILAACGGETTENVTNISQMGMDVVSSVGDLPKCTGDNEGEQAFVKGETSARICVDGKWFATKESVSDTVVLAGDTVYMGTGDLSCTTKELADGSGLKIVCNGDSIGVVLNGAKGDAGEPGEKGEDGTNGENGTGCTLAQTGTQLTITCGDKSATIDMGEGGGIVVDTATLDSEKIAISLDEVTGVSQKGPFLSGSKVLVKELEDGRSLSQTGNNFDGKILNDKGEFKITARMLVSQYVMLEATGYYRDEITGGVSPSTLTLFGITDVTTRSVVNINLLTHLEYERVIYLVTKKKMTVTAAKRQAQKEVFRLLDIDAEGFSNSEDLSIAGSSDEDGALLAFSVMFQANRTVAQLTELLSQIATDMEKDGTWDNSTAKMGIAEWAADADSSGQLAQIRNNVKNWNLSTMVPKFEPFVRHFWYKEYGLGDCTTERVNEVAAATAGKRKGTNTRYICKDMGEANGGYRWVIASDFEKDTYLWVDTTDGALKDGAVTGKKYVFDKTGSYNGAKGWRLAVAVENVYGGCREALYDSIRTYRGTNEAGYYHCERNIHRWVLTNNNLMIDTQGWAEGDDGFSKWGDSIGVVSGGNRTCYVYDTSAAYNGWRAGNNNDCTLGLMGCTKGRAGRMLEASDGGFYNCADNRWSFVDDPVKRNTIGWDCKDSNAGEMRLGVADDIYFVCDENVWRKATYDEEIACRNEGACRLCTESMQGQTEEREKIMYVCDKKKWREFNCAEKEMGVCTANDSALVENCENKGGFKIDYVCSDDHWHAVSSPYDYRLDDWSRKWNVYNEAAVVAKANSDSMITDPRDGNTYRTVVINGIRVFAENLRYADSSTTINLKGQTWCYNNEAKNCKIVGRYYTWTAAVNLNNQWGGGECGSFDH